MHNRLSQAWGKSANCLCSARVKQKSTCSRGLCLSKGCRGTRGNSLPSQWVQPALFSAIAAEREGKHCKGRQLLLKDHQVKGTDSQGVLFRRDALKTGTSLGTSYKLKLHPCSALYPAPLHHPVNPLTIFCVDYFKTFRVPSPQVLVSQQSAAENDQGTRVTCVGLRLRGLARTQPRGPEGSQGAHREERSKSSPPGCFSWRSIFREPRVEGETPNFVAFEPIVCILSNKRITITVRMKIIAATM